MSKGLCGVCHQQVDIAADLLAWHYKQDGSPCDGSRSNPSGTGAPDDPNDYDEAVASGLKKLRDGRHRDLTDAEAVGLAVEIALLRGLDEDGRQAYISMSRLAGKVLGHDKYTTSAGLRTEQLVSDILEDLRDGESATLTFTKRMITPEDFYKMQRGQ